MKITFSPNLSVATLQRATALAQSIEAKQAELQALLSGQAATRKGSKLVSKTAKHVRTPEQKAKISAGLKAAWAAKTAAKSPPVPQGAPVAATS